MSSSPTILELLPRYVEIKFGSMLGALASSVSNAVSDLVAVSVSSTVGNFLDTVDAQIEQVYQACDSRPNISSHVYTEDAEDLVIVSNDAIDSEYEFV